MGVRGLSTFVYSHESLLLKRYKLCQTSIIIDGNNFMYGFFENCADSVRVFGGDYDYIYSRVINFFDDLLKCGVDAILLFDGCPPESKFKTITIRRKESLESLIKLNRGSQSEPMNPILLFQTFLDGLDEMGVRHIQMYEEADREIAALAKHLKCPVLSGDSDFFLYDVDVIPLRKMDFTCREDKDGSLYFDCLLYQSGSMSRLFPGLQTPMLPMVNIIFGNDFVGKTFTHVFTESGNRSFRDIFEILRTSNNRESVIKKILQSLNGNEVEDVERAIREVLRNYEVPSPVSLSVTGVATQKTRGATVYGLNLSGLPDNFLRFYESGKLSVFMLGLLRYKRYNLPILIEDINENSSHFPSIPIIREIYKILRTLMRVPEDITLNIRVRRNLLDRREICPNQDYTSTALLRGNVLEQNEDFRRKVFFQSLGLDEIDGERLGEFDDDWILFVTSVVYWLRNTSKLKPSHLSAVLLMALSIYVKSMGECKGEYRRIRGNPTRSFTFLVKRIPNSEYTRFHERFNRVRKSDRDILARGDFFPATHAFACLQSVLMHVIQLNNLLGELLRGFLTSRFYSGTLLINLFVLSEVEEFTKVVMKDLPEMRGAYETLVDSVVFFWCSPERKLKKHELVPNFF